MPLAVDEKAIPADAVACWPGFDPAQVHAPEGELAKYVHQRARMIICQERDDGGLVRRRALWQLPREPDSYESGNRVIPVVDVGSKHNQAIQFGGEDPSQCIEGYFDDLIGGYEETYVGAADSAGQEEGGEG